MSIQTRELIELQTAMSKYPVVEYPPYPFEKSLPLVQVSKMPEQDCIRLWFKAGIPAFGCKSSVKDLFLYRVSLRRLVKSDNDKPLAVIENWLYVDKCLFDELGKNKTKAEELYRTAEICINHIVGLNTKYRQFEELPYLIRVDDIRRDFRQNFRLTDIKFKFCPECGADISKFFDDIQKEMGLLE